MKVTLLGHATVLVETGPMRILMDPVLHDPFENGMVVSCPKRAIAIERLGPIDLETALSIAPRLLVPASAGFCFAGEHAWLNPFLFPVSRERWAEDLRALDDAISVALLDPGDQVVLTGSEPRVARAASPIASTLEAGTAAIRFDPTAPIPPLRDPNPGDRRPSEMRETITSFLENELLAHCVEALGQHGSLAARYRRERVVYGIEVIFPDDGDAPVAPRAAWTFDFGAQPLRLTAGLAVRAYSRRHSTLCRVSRDASGVRVEATPLPDLLMHFTIYGAADSEDAAKRRIDHEISQLRKSGS